MVEKVKQQRVIIYTKELLTGSELIEVIKDYKLEDYLIERIDRHPIYETMNGYIANRKIIDNEYIYIFIDKEVKNG